jgi:hypothetical protein
MCDPSAAFPSRRQAAVRTAKLLTRTGLDWTDKYPNIIAPLANLKVRPPTSTHGLRTNALWTLSRPGARVRIFDQDGPIVSLTKLRRLADEESVKTH